MGGIFTRDGVVHCCERYTRITTKLELQLNHLIIKHKRHIAFCNLQSINQSIKTHLYSESQAASVQRAQFVQSSRKHQD